MVFIRFDLEEKLKVKRNSDNRKLERIGKVTKVNLNRAGRSAARGAYVECSVRSTLSASSVTLDNTDAGILER